MDGVTPGLGYPSESGLRELGRLMAARRPGETVRDVERREMAERRCPAVAEHASRGTQYQCERERHEGGTHESTYLNGKTFTWRDPDNGKKGVPLVGTRARDEKEIR